MQRVTPPPIKTPMYDQHGQMAHVWAKWFDDVSKRYEDYRRTPDKTFTNTGATLYTSDYGKNIRFENGTNNVTCFLMTPQTMDIDGWLTIFRTGTGRLDIIPTASARIEFGSLGGRIWCDETKRAAANLTLQLISTTQWAIVGATGLWKFA